jgi:hypothetical protein
MCEGGTEPVGQTIAAALKTAYSPPCPPELVTTEAVWNKEPEWDDLLIVVYKSGELPHTAQSYIQAFRGAHRTTKPGTAELEPGGAIIPVWTDPKHDRPPAPISTIRSVGYDGTSASLAQISRAAGVFLGLAVRPHSQRIFVAYRGSDGKEIAHDLHDRLLAAGFLPWLDIAEDNVTVGDDVQDRIREHIKQAGAILVVDTPDAPDSDWLRLEVEIATSQLIPVLPVVAGGERNSRIIPLDSLRRCAVVKQDGVDRKPLSDNEWLEVRKELEELMLTTYRRRLRILTRAQQIFTIAGFKWTVLDERLRMYKAEKKKLPLPVTIVLSHCSVHDPTYLPVLNAYAEYIKNFPAIASVNHKLCVYDRERVLSYAEFDALDKSLNGIQFILAHYNELDILIQSNFTKLREYPGGTP